MKGVFSVLFKERCQSVLCVILESFLFVCFNLYCFAKSFKGSYLATSIESRFQHWQYHGVSSVSILAEKAEN